MGNWKMTGADIISDRIAYWRDRKKDGYQPATYILDELGAIYWGVKLAETGMNRKVVEEVVNGGERPICN